MHDETRTTTGGDDAETAAGTLGAEAAPAAGPVPPFAGPRLHGLDELVRSHLRRRRRREAFLADRATPDRRRRGRRTEVTT
jgi:hypothetical protein